MRMRKKKHTVERMEVCKDIFVDSPEMYRGNWRKVFSERMETSPDMPLHIEIGCGKGAFILESAKRNPDKAFIALEFCREAIMLAMEKVYAERIKNVLFLNQNALDLEKFFDDGELDLIYLNFSDPWPKSRHAKRRLTSPVFLGVYKKVLKEKGAVLQKTDNLPLFEYSLESFQNSGFEVFDVCRDLHNSPMNKDNIVTEYELNFSQKGFKINSLTARKI